MGSLANFFKAKSMTFRPPASYAFRSLFISAQSASVAIVEKAGAAPVAKSPTARRLR
jgi:hypothetical protein